MEQLLGLFIWLKARLSEPSTMASVAAVLAMVGVHIDEGVYKDIMNVLTLVFGAMGFWVKEGHAETKVD